MRQLLVEMALQMSKINISEQRRIHVESLLDTKIISGLMCGLFLWVIVCYVHTFYHNVLQEMCKGIFSYMALGECWEMRIL
jgi:hypothetical protein